MEFTSQREPGSGPLTEASQRWDQVKKTSSMFSVSPEPSLGLKSEEAFHKCVLHGTEGNWD